MAGGPNGQVAIVTGGGRGTGRAIAETFAAAGAAALLPGMVARRRGRVLSVASRAATLAIPCFSAYFTAKAAVARLSEVLALETAEHGVSVFAVDPGGVRRAMTDAYFGSAAGRRWMPGWAEAMERANSTPALAAALCVLLASGAADALRGRFVGVHDDVAALARHAAAIQAHELYTLRLRTTPVPAP
jgi:NAD(P)-dependent dehydrogenase (short-subunit alcohol dehydrogenase family)